MIGQEHTGSRRKVILISDVRKIFYSKRFTTTTRSLITASTRPRQFDVVLKPEKRRLLVPHSTGPHRNRGLVLLFECHGGRGGAGRPRSPRRHRPPQSTTSAHALQLHNEYVDLKPDGMTKKKIIRSSASSPRRTKVGAFVLK